MSKKQIIIIIFSIILGIIAVSATVFLINKKFFGAQVLNINPIAEQREKSVDISVDIFENVSPDTKEKIQTEQKKIRALRGKVEKIEQKILFVKSLSGEIKDKDYQIQIVSETKVQQTKIDKQTGIPMSKDYSFAQIKIGDEIIAWAKEDIRNKTEFETEYIEVMVEPEKLQN